MTDYLWEHNVETPMRDGVVLRMDVVRPADGVACPVLLSRAPYGKSSSDADWIWYFHLPQALEAGYAVAFQDTRGRFESDGDFVPVMREARGRLRHDRVDRRAATGVTATSACSVRRTTASPRSSRPLRLRRV